ncbi:MAG: hypothetical protein WCP36_05755 [Methanomicrobiales archaeon]
MKVTIYFASEEIKQQYTILENGSSEEKVLFSLLNKSIDSLFANVFCGIQIPKKQIPKKYLKTYKITNLWKLNISSSYRLVYSVASADDGTIAVVIEWFDHKEYERRFNY